MKKLCVIAARTRTARWIWTIRFEQMYRCSRSYAIHYFFSKRNSIVQTVDAVDSSMNGNWASNLLLISPARSHTCAERVRERERLERLNRWILTMAHAVIIISKATEPNEHGTYNIPLKSVLQLWINFGRHLFGGDFQWSMWRNCWDELCIGLEL